MAAHVIVKGSEKELLSGLTDSEIINALSAHKVTTGIDHASIQKILSQKIYNKTIRVAHAIEPETGRDARVVFLKKIKKKKDVIPPQTEDGQIDYYAPREGFLNFVNKGESLGMKYPPERGKQGTNVLGEEIPGIMGKEISLDLFAGSNTKIEDNKIIAESDGILELDGYKINVLKRYEIKENIGKNTGSITIPPDVECQLVVHGDIQNGYSVTCNSLTVYGCIEDAEVFVKNLEVKEGIVGLGKQKITADHIKAGYINGTREVYTKTLVVLREISSGAKIYSNTVKALAIQGSSVTARDAVWTDFINGKNSIVVGVDYHANMEYNEIIKSIHTMDEPLEELKSQRLIDTKRMKKLVELSRINPNHPLIKKELPRIREAKIKLDRFIAIRMDLINKKEVLLHKMYSKGKYFLFVRERLGKDSSSGQIVGPNTTITLADRTIKITDTAAGGLFYIKEHDIVKTSRYNIKEIKNLFDSFVTKSKTEQEDPDGQKNDTI